MKPNILLYLLSLFCSSCLLPGQEPQRVRFEHRFHSKETWSYASTDSVSLWFRLLIDREPTNAEEVIETSATCKYETLEVKPDKTARVRIDERFLTPESVKGKSAARNLEVRQAIEGETSLGALVFATGIASGAGSQSFTLSFNLEDSDFPPFPRDPVAAGDAWDDFIEFKHEGKGIKTSVIKLPVRSMLMSLRDGNRSVARIRRAGHAPVNLTFRVPVIEVDATLRGIATFTQTLRFDYQRGRELDRETRVHTQLAIDAEAPNGSKVKVELIGGLEAKRRLSP